MTTNKIGLCLWFLDKTLCSSILIFIKKHIKKHDKFLGGSEDASIWEVTYVHISNTWNISNNINFKAHI